MQIEETFIEGCFIIHDTWYEDDRGYFFESFNKRTFFEKAGILVDFVQDNQSSSCKGVLRGLHFQHGEFAQAKLVRVLNGNVLDVAVDLRKKSKTFGKHVAIELSSENKKQLFIPRGFAHGFLVLSEQATFFYKCDNYYNKSSEGGIIYNDKSLNIDWLMSDNELIISEKDKSLQPLNSILNF